MLMTLLYQLAAPHLQLQLDRFHTYAIAKGLRLNAHKIKLMTFFCSSPPIFYCNCLSLENVQVFEDLCHYKRMKNTSNQIACKFAGAIT